MRAAVIKNAYSPCWRLSASYIRQPWPAATY